VPNVLLEASACGTPWVASRVGGIPEIAHLGVGRLVPPATPPELARAIREALAGPRGGTPPRPRAEAVAELAGFLGEVVARHARSTTSSNEAVELPWPGAAEPPLSAAHPTR
jgi:glycosyltransferase involved in cell wall biosynthesis